MTLSTRRFDSDEGFFLYPYTYNNDYDCDIFYLFRTTDQYSLEEGYFRIHLSLTHRKTHNISALHRY